MARTNCGYLTSPMSQSRPALCTWPRLLPWFYEQFLLEPSQSPFWSAYHVLHRGVAGAHLRQNFLCGNAAIHQPDALGLAVLALDAREKAAQCRAVTGVARHHFVGQRQSLGCHHQRDHYLHAIGAMVARVSVPALVIFWKRRIGFKIGAGQIVEQHVEADVEQIAPASDQVIE